MVRRVVVCLLSLHALACSGSSFSSSSGTQSPNKSASKHGVNTAGDTDTPTTAQTSAVASVAPASLPALAPPQGAVTQGSFTVWTYPANPGVNIAYTIYTEIRLPPHTSAYDEGDLSGEIRGSDGYTQRIGPGSKNEVFTFKGTTALLTNAVPGSYGGVKDAVVIHSTLLNEQQTLTLTFGGAP